jgi:hypothetical protein
VSTVFVVPDNPGTKITITGEETQRPPSISETVAVIGSHDWGPSRAVTRVNSFGEFESVFGSSDTDLRDAVLGAFVGPGTDGGVGAGSVLVYRAGLASGGGALNQANRTIQNTAGTPADALTLTAKHDGTFGNDLSFVIENDPIITNYDRLRILLNGVTVEKYTYPQTNITALGTAINDRPSKYVTAEVLVTGTALAATAGTALTNGADGTAITVTEYEDAVEALEFAPFSILGAANLVTTAIQTALMEWSIIQEEEMRPVRLIFGGPAGETLDQATTRSDAVRDPHVISLGAGTFHDAFLDKDVGSAKLVGRVAGALAGVGNGRALTYLPFAGLTVIDPIEVPTERLREAADNGVTVFRRSSGVDGDLIISKGVTTFIDADAARPVNVFGEPRLVGIVDQFIREMKIWGDENIVGLPNSEPTRAAVRDKGSELLTAYADDNLIINTVEDPFFFRVPDPDPENPDLIPFEFGWKFAATTNYLVGVGKVRV